MQAQAAEYSGYAEPFRCFLALTTAFGFVTWARNWRLVSMRGKLAF
jgi:hypothetical protein